MCARKKNRWNIIYDKLASSRSVRLLLGSVCARARASMLMCKLSNGIAISWWTLDMDGIEAAKIDTNECCSYRINWIVLCSLLLAS